MVRDAPRAEPISTSAASVGTTHQGCRVSAATTAPTGWSTSRARTTARTFGRLGARIGSHPTLAATVPATSSRVCSVSPRIRSRRPPAVRRRRSRTRDGSSMPCSESNPARSPNLRAAVRPVPTAEARPVGIGVFQPRWRASRGCGFSSMGRCTMAANTPNNTPAHHIRSYEPVRSKSRPPSHTPRKLPNW